MAARPQYLGASVAPVLVGSALGYSVGDSFHLGLFALATLAIMALHAALFFGGVFYLLTLPLAIFAMRSANTADLARPGLYRANQLTILLHNVGSLGVAAGLFVPGLFH
jgi:hypothetical protein